MVTQSSGTRTISVEEFLEHTRPEPRRARAKSLWKRLVASGGQLALSVAEYDRLEKRCNMKRADVDRAITDLVDIRAAHIDADGNRGLTLVRGRRR